MLLLLHFVPSKISLNKRVESNAWHFLFACLESSWNDDVWTMFERTLTLQNHIAINLIGYKLDKQEFPILTSFMRWESSSGKASNPVLFNFNHRKFGMSATRFGKSSFYTWNKNTCIKTRFLDGGDKRTRNRYLEVIPGQIQAANERQHTFRHFSQAVVLLTLRASLRGRLRTILSLASCGAKTLPTNFTSAFLKI